MITVRTVTGEVVHAANRGGPLGFGSLCRRIHPARNQHPVVMGLTAGDHAPDVTCKPCIRALSAEIGQAWELAESMRRVLESLARTPERARPATGLHTIATLQTMVSDGLLAQTHVTGDDGLKLRRTAYLLTDKGLRAARKSVESTPEPIEYPRAAGQHVFSVGTRVVRRGFGLVGTVTAVHDDHEGCLTVELDEGRHRIVTRSWTEFAPLPTPERVTGASWTGFTVPADRDVEPTSDEIDREISPDRVTDPAAAELLAHHMVTLLSAMTLDGSHHYRDAVADPGHPQRPALDVLESMRFVHAWNDGTGYAVTTEGEAAVRGAHGPYSVATFDVDGGGVKCLVVDARRPDGDNVALLHRDRTAFTRNLVKAQRWARELNAGTRADAFYANASDGVAVTALTGGESYTATTTSVLRGERLHREVRFVASRDQITEPLIRDHEGTPDQDRVFHVDAHGSTPMLVVAGSIRAAGETVTRTNYLVQASAEPVDTAPPTGFVPAGDGALYDSIVPQTPEPSAPAVRADDAVLDTLGGRDEVAADEAAAALGRLESTLLAWRRAIDAKPFPANPYPMPADAAPVWDLGHVWRDDAGRWSAVDAHGILVAHEADEVTARRLLHLAYAAKSLHRERGATVRDGNAVTLYRPFARCATCDWFATAADKYGAQRLADEHNAAAHSPDGAAPALRWETPPCTGQAEVEQDTDYESRTLHVAGCVCGWAGPRRDEFDEAQADANLHNSAVRPVNGPYTLEQIVGIGGNRWDGRNGVTRVYLDWESWAGLEIRRYNTGNVRSATLDGVTMSNTRAARVTSYGRAYWQDGQIRSTVAEALTDDGFASHAEAAERRLLDEIARQVAALPDDARD